MQRDVRVLDVAYLWAMYRDDRLVLRPEYQRNAIWPAAAKSYLIDTLITGRPVPLIFLSRMISAQTGASGFAVVDGQQRLSAIFDFLENRFRLTGPDVSAHYGARFRDLGTSEQEAILAYGVVVEELHGYSGAEVVEVFVRLNKYGVRLAPQELRHATGKGEFKKAAEDVGGWPFWLNERVITKARGARMRADEIAAELLILLAEAGPQDKKNVVTQYYTAYEKQFPDRDELLVRLGKYLEWLSAVLPNDPKSRFRKPVGLYGLVGALDRVSGQGRDLRKLSTARASSGLQAFNAELMESPPTPRAGRYLAASARQTDNIGPRSTRISILAELLEGART